MFKKYFRNILMSFDQLVNTFLGGDPDMSLSARLGRNYKDSWMRKLVDWFFIRKSEHHCQDADWWEQDEGKDQVIK